MAVIADEFLSKTEPLVEQGNEFAALWHMKMLMAEGDTDAERAVVSDLFAAIQPVMKQIGRVYSALVEAGVAAPNPNAPLR